MGLGQCSSDFSCRDAENGKPCWLNWNQGHCKSNALVTNIMSTSSMCGKTNAVTSDSKMSVAMGAFQYCFAGFNNGRDADQPLTLTAPAGTTIFLIKNDASKIDETTNADMFKLSTASDIRKVYNTVYPQIVANGAVKQTVTVKKGGTAVLLALNNNPASNSWTAMLGAVETSAARVAMGVALTASLLFAFN